MSAERRSRFSAWQEANQVRREKLIVEYLAYLEKTRVRVRNPTDLADLVARHISQAEGAPCNKATLMRNLRYKSKILTFQAKALSGVNATKAHSLPDPAARALVTTSQLEAGNLRRELNRLNIYVKSLEAQVDERRDGNMRPTPDASSHLEPTAHFSDDDYRFVRTCQALRAVLSHLSTIFEVDMKSQEIRDRSKRRDNVVVAKEVAGPFVDWLARLRVDPK